MTQKAECQRFQLGLYAYSALMLYLAIFSYAHVALAWHQRGILVA